MPYLYLVSALVMHATFSIFGRMYQDRTAHYKDVSPLFNFAQMISVTVVWGVFFALKFSFDAGVLLYSALFAVCYTSVNVGFIRALKLGTTMLSTLILNLALVVTTTWGFLFWDAKPTAIVIVGLILVVVALYLCLYQKKNVENKSFSWKWLFYALCALFGNSGCSIVQRTQQLKYNGQHGSMLMFFATLFSAIVCFFIYLKSDKSDTKMILRRNWWLPVCSGIGNVGLNVFVMLLTFTMLSPSLIYPVLGVGALMVVTLVSTLVFKERLKPLQWVGFLFGTVAIVLLSL